MRLSSRILALAVITCFSGPTWACDLIPPKRNPTIAERVAGLERIFAGTVIGFRDRDGVDFIGPLPSECTEDEDFPYWGEFPASCHVYLEMSDALIEVEVPVVDATEGEIIVLRHSWDGGADCGTTYEVGENWLIAGSYSQVLNAPLRQSEIDLLRRLASHPPFDFQKLYD